MDSGMSLCQSWQGICHVQHSCAPVRSMMIFKRTIAICRLRRLTETHQLNLRSPSCKARLLLTNWPIKKECQDRQSSHRRFPTQVYGSPGRAIHRLFWIYLHHSLLRRQGYCTGAKAHSCITGICRRHQFRL